MAILNRPEVQGMDDGSSDSGKSVVESIAHKLLSKFKKIKTIKLKMTGSKSSAEPKIKSLKIKIR